MISESCSCWFRTIGIVVRVFGGTSGLMYTLGIAVLAYLCIGSWKAALTTACRCQNVFPSPCIGRPSLCVGNACERCAKALVLSLW